MSIQQSKQGRGRPITTDPAEVGLNALRLFSEQGIDRVTMEQVAAAAGISRSNLFRVFPSKAAVVWGGMHNFTAELAKQLETGEASTVVQLLHRSWVDAMQMADNSLETVRLRLKIIGSSPEVYGWGQGQLDQARLVLENAVIRFGGDALRAKAVSAAMLSASVAILIWWAETDDPRTPSEVLDDGFSDFESLFG
ncbi:MAG: TetR family transcriptional regulator [Aquiluna sp.]|nr:TetR family transcriptional regulator [Aquiluna sp.]